MKLRPFKHNGRVYRSLTEARWAVFLTEARAPFVYHPECYDLGPGYGFFTPTFWLSAAGKFMVVLPDPPPIYVTPPSGISYGSMLSRVTGGKEVITFCGPPFVVDDYDTSDPNYENGILSMWQPPDAGDPEGRPGEDYSYWFCCCPHCKMVGIEFNGRSDRIGCKCPKSTHGDKGYNHEDPLLLSARDKALNTLFS